MRRPIPAEAVAAAALRFGHIVLDGSDVYWIEGRPAEGGRSVIVRRRADGSIADVTPPGVDVRTRVNEYGGAAFSVSRGTIVYSEFSDQRLYKLTSDGQPEAMTPAGAWRYADAAIDPRRAALVCVREIRGREPFSAATPKMAPDPVTTLVSLPLDGRASAGDVIASGQDFYSTPRFSPDGAQLAWLAWRHPQMPWNGTELWLADVADDGAVRNARKVAGGERESIFQPGWSPDGLLHFVSDRTGWWNIYRLRGEAAEAVYAVDADCGRPQWQFGMATWAFAGPSRLVVAQSDRGSWRLVEVRPPATDSHQPATRAAVLTGIEPADFLAADASHVVFVGGSGLQPDSVVRIDLASAGVEILRASGPSADPSATSLARATEFPTGDGETAYAFFYAPSIQPGSDAPAGQRAAAEQQAATEQQAAAEQHAPPLIVVCHGGPTGASSARLNLEIQFWTSRGFAVVDVNYRGSAGFGRAYRDRLAGQWGIVDVEDCVNAALHLARSGLADRRRLIIRGKSAGGFTSLAALTFHPDVFAAAAIYYGIGDLELLARDTHKFESRYLDQLVGPYPAARDLYVARSPIQHLERLSCPMIVFQGLEDKVVPPEHADAIVGAVRGRGLRVEFLALPGEGHGFRRADTIARCLEAEYNFMRTVMPDLDV